MQPESSETGEKCVSATGGPAVQGPAGLGDLRCVWDGLGWFGRPEVM